MKDTGTIKLGEEVLAEVEENVRKKEAEENQKQLKRDEAYLKLCVEADKVLANEPNDTKWTVKDLKAVLKPLKLKNDCALPTTKQSLMNLYHQWKGRSRRVINGPLREIRGDDSNDVPVTEPIVNKSQSNDISESVEL